MTQEEKELLLKDLCARLPYMVKITWDGKHQLTVTPHIYCAIASESNTDSLPKLLLRSMTSITKEEREYIEDRCAFTTIGPIGGKFCLAMPVIAAEWLIDFYNSHHLDWRGLIEKGLALEAPEGMYN